MTIDIKIDLNGPLLDGSYHHVLDDAIEAMNREIAHAGEGYLHSIMGQSFRNPTGYFESKIRTTMVNKDVVIDDPVIYGPWLEGVSSRNRTSRFKGYSIFRRATQQLERTAGDIGERVISRFVGRLNG